MDTLQMNIVPGRSAELPDSVVLQPSLDDEVLPAFRTPLRFVEALDLTLTWSLKVHWLSSSRRPFLDSAGLVRVLLGEGDPCIFWRPNQQQRRRRGAQAWQDLPQVEPAAEPESEDGVLDNGAEEPPPAAARAAVAERENAEDGGSDHSESIFENDLLALWERAEAQAVESESSSSTSTSSSNSSSTSVRAVLEPRPEVEPPVARPGHMVRLRREETFTVGSFLFTYKPPRTFQCTCRFHSDLHAPSQPHATARQKGSPTFSSASNSGR